MTDIEILRQQFKTAGDEVHQLYHMRNIWKNIQGMIDAPGIKREATISNWLTTVYSRTLAVGIRRQAEVKHQKGQPRPTIGNLLCRLEEDPAAFTRDSLGFVQTDPFLDGWSGVANTSGTHVDDAKVTHLKDNLIAAEETARDWVNSRVAHLDPGASEEVVTFQDLERGLSGLRDASMFLFSVFNKGGSLIQMTPVATPTWFRMFQKPWYVEGQTQFIDPIGDGELG